MDSHHAEIKALQQDLTAVREEVKGLAQAILNQRFDQQRDRENMERDREMLILRLENVLLRFERRIPPPAIGDDLPTLDS